MGLKNINLSPRFTQYLVSSNTFKQTPMVIVDVGARGGFEEHWSLYRDQARLIGFEADVAECERLNQQDYGLYKCFYPIALHQDVGQRRFYATAYPSSSSFYQPDMNLVQRFPDRVNLSVVDTIELKTNGFDSFAAENDIRYVDFLKLDTESAELDILKGAVNILKKSVLGLTIEMWFQPWHLGQPVFSDIDSFLRPLGFRLFDLVTYRMSREAFPEAFHSGVPEPTKRGQVISGDALYLRDGVSEIASERFLEDNWDDIKLLKLASIMELFDLPDCAIELVQTAKRTGYIQDLDINQLADLLVPDIGGKHVSYLSYLENVKRIQKSRYVSGTQKIKSLFLRFTPLGVHKIIGTVLTRIRDTIDNILE